MSNPLRVPIYTTEPHHLTVGWLIMDLGLTVEQDENGATLAMQVTVEGTPHVEDDPKAMRRVDDGAILYVDTTKGRIKIGQVEK